MNNQLQIAYPQTFKLLNKSELENYLSSDDQSKQFHDYLRSNQVLPDRPYLADMALLEHLLYQSYTAKCIPFNLDMDGLLIHLEECPQDVVLEVSDSLFLLKSSFPIQEIWQKIKLDGNLDQINIAPGNYHYVINTIAESTGAYLVSPIIYHTVTLLKEEKSSLDEIVTKLFANSTQAELEKVLQYVLSSGWIQRYHLRKL